MAAKRDTDRAQPGGGPVVFLPPPPPAKRYRAKLDTCGDIERELRRIYREARSGVIPVPDACRFAFLLTSLSKVREAGELEARLERLEANDHP